MMQRFINPLVFHDSDGPIKRFVGVELEIATLATAQERELREVVMKWGGSIVDDGSVRGNNPFELRTSPARGIKFEQQMREICRVLRKGGAKADATCGMHMHIDARDLGPNDLIKIATMWPHVENRFFEKTLRKRADSNYCHKWANSLPAFRKDQPLIRMYDELKLAMARRGRFMSLNYDALRTHGTIENRAHHGTININKILAWAKMNVDFIEFARETTFDNIDNRIEILAELFPKAEKVKPAPIIK